MSNKQKFFLISFIILVLTLLHYLTPVHKPLLHDIYRRLYYLPIILSAFSFGIKGALVSSITISIVFFPHVFHRWGHIYLQTTDALFEILLYNIVAWVTGALVEVQRRQRQKLAEAQQELLRVSKFKLLGELASGMAHEIKNPLSAIKGSLEILKEDYKPEDKKYEFINILFKEINRLNKVVSDFLNYTRPEKPTFNLCDLNQVVGESISFITPQAKQKRIQILTDLKPNLPRIEADPSQLKQAFLNLLLNSVQAIENGAQIQVSTYKESDGENVTVKFQDNGPGISPENLEKIFVPFFTTKKDGVGLGLGIVERIVQNHQGKIDLESKLGSGTTFYLKFPTHIKRQ